MSKEYEAAREAHNAACHIYDHVRDRYRANEIGDDEFLAALEIMNKAGVAFDAAFHAEANMNDAT